MKILIDTREGKPLKFYHPYIKEIINRKLDVGDYGCEFNDGYIMPVVFERKEHGDLVGTLGKGYERFKREIERAKQQDIKLILIIEGTMTKILNGTDYSMRDGLSIIKQLFTLWLKYDLIPVFCKDREEMSKYITEYYIACGKQYMKVDNGLKNANGQDKAADTQREGTQEEVTA
jgi:ERCC4-type nuclease